MRQVPSDFDPTVKAALDQAKALMAAGDVPSAIAVYRHAWDAAIARDDHHHAAIVAHMAGVAEPDPAKKVRWNVDALREADAVEDPSRVAGFYSSLYGNLALSLAMTGELDAALRYQELAVSRLPNVEPGPYRDRVVAGTMANLERIKLQIAERDTAKAAG